jgi:hypothetical protein
LDPTKNIVHYPTFIEDEMYIDFPDTISGDSKIEIYSISGQKVFSQSLTFAPLQRTTLNLINLKSGLHLVKFQFNHFSTNWKIIKK